MKLLLSIHLAAVIVAATFCAGPSAQAQNVYCVRAGATGANSGLDWNNAYGALPSVLLRGATYLIADGTYAGYSFDDATAGTTLITIKKATVASHGTSTGWSDAYGDGQAVFSSSVTFGTSYWLFDGVTGGGPGNWTSGFGFKVMEAGTLVIGMFGNNITVKNVDAEGGGPDGDGVGASNDIIWAGVENSTLLIQSNYLHDAGRCIVFGPANNVTFEYNYTGQHESTPGEHSEIFSCDVDNADATEIHDWTVRYNLFTWSEGTGGLIFEGTNIFIYGNVFAPVNGGSLGGGNGLVGTWGGDYIRNLVVYNNTFIGSDVWVLGIFNGTPISDTVVFKNNLIYNSPWYEGYYTWVTHTHNHYVDIGSVSEATGTTATGDPFVNWGAMDFRLEANTTAGSDLGSPYNVDMYGHTRTTWTRGAIEFGTASSGLTANAGSDQTVALPNSATLVGSYVNTLGGIVTLGWSKVSGPGTVGFSPPAAATTTATFSSAGTYVLRLTASVSLVSASDDVTVTVQAAPDTTAPTVSLTAPFAGGVVSNSVTLSATASDNSGGVGVTNVTFLVDGVVVGNDATAPYSVAWNSQAVANSSHTIQARAVDGAGNQTTSASVTVTTQNPAPDTTPPSGSLTAPSTGAVVSNSITLSATASDNSGGSGVASVSFLVDGVVVGSDNASPYSISWDSLTVANGSHTLQARAMDGAGNQTTSGSVTVTVQNLTPILDLAFSEGQGTTASDSSGFGNNSSLVNGVTWSLQAVSFDGLDDYVRVPSSSSLESVNQALTVSAMVKIQTNGQWQTIVRKVLQEGAHDFPYAAYDLIVEESGGALRARMAVSSADGSRGVVYGNTALNFNQWYHLAGVYDGAAVRVYVNGTQDGNASFSGDIVQTTGQPFLIGRNGGGGDSFKGSLDEVRIYNRVLTDAEIRALGIQSQPVPASPSNLRVVSSN